MAKLPRRKFLKTIGGAAVATALPDVVFGAQSQSPSIALFWEPSFPSPDIDISLEILQRALLGLAPTVLSERELIAQLDAGRFDLLITPYGSAFPKRAWKVMLKYLRDGGNWLNLGGVPLTRPVVFASNRWKMEAPHTAYHKRLGITHSFPVDAHAITIYQATPNFMGGKEFETLIKAAQIHELYIRLSSSNNEPDEAGSDGPHEGAVQPLVLAFNHEGRSIAAPVIQIDRLLADFAGGRWVFANINGTLDPKVLNALAKRAAQGASRLEVKSAFACYRPVETPSLSVKLIRPKRNLEKLTPGDCRIQVHDESGRVVSRLNVSLNTQDADAMGPVNLPDASTLAPGFYKVYAQTTLNSEALAHATGFWVHDHNKATPSKPLTVDKHFFYRDGKVFPVTGTTYMASDKHRRFLFEPNPFVWDNDFQAMKQAGVNMVRTGIWTGWKRYMTAEGKVDESILRAFDAFILTAQKYDIPVIFNFFAFLPESWGGENAYLDPRSVKAQQQFVSAFAARCFQCDDVIWDLINEPSFCSPKYLWNCRPNYDAHEKAAWKQWLRQRYPAESEDDHIAQLRERWRATGDDVLDLPKLQDFESVHLIDDRLPLKTLDYRLFAQDMFIRWVRQMTEAIRSTLYTKRLITVGQDEGGLGDSPNMQFYEKEIDFVSLHNWWANDDLVWDSVMGKTPSKLNLMEETGVMFYEKADGGAPWRSEQDVSNLLERKLAISFAADGAGFIEWIWNTNPYMNSTNEVGIGFHRVDGTAKPELEPFLRIARFMGQHGQHLKERIAEPVVMLIPHSQMFAPRSFAFEATRRCVRAMYYHCGVPMQAISEYKLTEYLGHAKLIVVPSPSVLTEKCYDALMHEAERGATVCISGVVDVDYVSGMAPPSEFKIVPVAQSETISIAGREYVVRYDGEKMQRIEKVVTKTSDKAMTQKMGAGLFVRSTLPLELGDSMAALVAFYRLALSLANITPTFNVTPQTPSVLVLPAVFRDVVLYTFVSESDRDTQMEVMHKESRTHFNVSVPSQRTAMVLIERRTGRIIGRLGG